MKHTVLVTGANGQLGTEIRNAVSGEMFVSGKYNEKLAPCEIVDNYGNTYIFTSRHPLEYPQTQDLDITDIDSINKVVKNKGVDVIVNCAAYTNVDMAEGIPKMRICIIILPLLTLLKLPGRQTRRSSRYRRTMFLMENPANLTRKLKRQILLAYMGCPNWQGRGLLLIPDAVI